MWSHLHEPLAKLPRTQLWAAVADLKDPELQGIVDCVCREAGWPRHSVAQEMVQLHKHLHSAIQDTGLCQQSVTKVDLVVPYPLQFRQAKALQCLAEHFDIPVRVVQQESLSEGE